MQGQQSLIPIEARLSNLSYAKDLHHLLARRPVKILRSFLQKTYFSLKVIILKSGASLQKALDKVAFL